MEKKVENQASGGTLGLSALIAIAVGQVIGVGVINTTGLAIAETGQSTWIAYILAVLFGFVWILPAVFFSSIARFKGGYYALVTSLLGEKAGGLYALWYMPMYLATAMVGVGIGNYIHAIFPFIPGKVAGFVLLTLFWLINMRGLSLMANFQRPMTAMLVVCLAVFGIAGIMKAQSGALDVTSDGYFLNGGAGLFSALVLLIYSTSGQGLVIGFSWNAKKPQRDIPIAICVATVVILVLYSVVAFGATSVLPIEEVAGKPLTVAARAMFPDTLYYLFVFCGPVLALVTTLNSGFAALTAPILGGVRNGWLPAGIARTNKNGAPYILYTVMYLLGVLPLLFGVPLNTLTNYTVITQRITGTLACLAMFMIPIKFKSAWQKSWLHLPNPVYYAIAVFALGTQLIAVYLSARSLGWMGFIINMAVVIALAAVALVRHKLGKVHSQISCEIIDE